MKEFVSPTTYQRGQVLAFVLTPRHEFPADRQDWYNMLIGLVEIHARRITGPGLTSGYPKDPTELKSVTFDYVAKHDGADHLFFELFAEWMPELKLLFIEPDSTFFGPQRAWLLTGKIDRVTGFAHDRDISADRSKDPVPAYRVEWRGTVLYNTEEVRLLAAETIARFNLDGSRIGDPEWQGHHSWLKVFAKQDAEREAPTAADTSAGDPAEAEPANPVDFAEFVVNYAYIARPPRVVVRKIEGPLPTRIYDPLKLMLEDQALRVSGLVSGISRALLDRYSDGITFVEQGISFTFNAKYAGHNHRYIEGLIRESGVEGCQVDVLFFEYDPAHRYVLRTWSGKLTLESVSGWTHDRELSAPLMGSDQDDPLQFHVTLTGVLRYGHPDDNEEALAALTQLNPGTADTQRSEQEA